jgi:hypothetical protein
VLSDGVQAQF